MNYKFPPTLVFNKHTFLCMYACIHVILICIMYTDNMHIKK